MDFLTKFNEIDISESDTLSFSYLDDCQAMIESVALRAVYKCFENPPNSFGIDSLLKFMLEKSVISIDTYYLALTKLVENNYMRISISVDHFKFIIRYDGFVIRPEHHKLFSIFSSQEYVFIDLVNILNTLLVFIWNDINPDIKKKFEWSDYLLGQITLNPKMNTTIEGEMLKTIGSNIQTKQNCICFFDYIKHRMLFSPEE